MASKKKKVYAEGVLPWNVDGVELDNVDGNFIIPCPFCLRKVSVNYRASLRDGKKCGGCKAKIYMNGFASRGYTPNINPQEEIKRVLESVSEVTEEDKENAQLLIEGKGKFKAPKNLRGNTDDNRS